MTTIHCNHTTCPHNENGQCTAKELIHEVKGQMLTCVPIEGRK